MLPDRTKRTFRSLTTLAAACALAVAGLATGAHAADAKATLAVGTVETVTAETLTLKTDDGVKTVTVVDVDRMPALAAGDPVALTWRDENGTWVAHQVWKPAAADLTRELVTVRATPGASNVELLVVDEVAEGNVRDLLGAGEVESTVLLAGADRLKVRTTEGPLVVLNARSVGEGGTDFETGENLLVSVTPATALALSANRGSTTTVYERKEPIVAEVDTQKTPATTEPAMRDTTMSSEPTNPAPTTTEPSKPSSTLPQTANDHHRYGLVGLVLLTAAIGAALLRRTF